MALRSTVLIAGLAIACVANAVGWPAGHRGQLLPHVPGYIPVYIQSGDAPPDVERLYESQRTLPLKAAPSNREEIRVAPNTPNSRRPLQVPVVQEAAPTRAQPQDEQRASATRTRSAQVVPTLPAVPLEEVRIAPTPSRRASATGREGFAGAREVLVKEATPTSRITKKGGAGPAPAPVESAPGSQIGSSGAPPSKAASKKRTGPSSYRASQQYKSQKAQQLQREQQLQHQKAAQTRRRQQQQHRVQQQEQQR